MLAKNPIREMRRLLRENSVPVSCLSETERLVWYAEQMSHLLEIYSFGEDCSCAEGVECLVCRGRKLLIE